VTKHLLVHVEQTREGIQAFVSYVFITMSNTKERFSSRVEHYAKYRPGYPVEILEFLGEQCGLTSKSIIADIGSGTGKLSELFLGNGNIVFAVEPNSAMRAAAEELLGRTERLISIDGSAESTTLSDATVDIVAAGQAFHWFDRPKAKIEFIRILKPDGWVVIIWNERRLEATPFLRAYEELLLRYGTDYQEVRHENTAGELAGFFSPNKVIVKAFENRQEFDLEGVTGRISSTSYTPEPGTEQFLMMVDALQQIFAQHAVNGRVVFEYDTRIYLGQLR